MFKTQHMLSLYTTGPIGLCMKHLYCGGFDQIYLNIDSHCSTCICDDDDDGKIEDVGLLLLRLILFWHLSRLKSNIIVYIFK